MSKQQARENYDPVDSYVQYSVLCVFMTDVLSCVLQESAESYDHHNGNKQAH